MAGLGHVVLVVTWWSRMIGGTMRGARYVTRADAVQRAPAVEFAVPKRGSASDPFCRDIKRLSLILRMRSGRRHHARFSVRYLLGQPIIGGSAVHLMPL